MPSASPDCCLYVSDWPRANFFTLRFFDPRRNRGASLGFRFGLLGAVRLDFLRSSLVSSAVFAMNAVNFSLTSLIENAQA